MLLFARPPLFQVREEGASRSQSGIDGGPAKQRRDIWRDLCERHDGCWSLSRRMGELLQGRERLFVVESQDAFMGLDTIEVEGDDPIEEGLIGRKVLGMLRLVTQCLPDRRGCLGHVCFLLAPCAAPVA